MTPLALGRNLVDLRGGEPHSYAISFSHTILASAWEVPCIMRYPHLPTFEAEAEEGISVGEDEGEDLVAPTMVEAT